MIITCIGGPLDGKVVDDGKTIDQVSQGVNAIMGEQVHHYKFVVVDDTHLRAEYEGVADMKKLG